MPPGIPQGHPGFGTNIFAAPVYFPAASWDRQPLEYTAYASINGAANIQHLHFILSPQA
jgi:hypothetical protein